MDCFTPHSEKQNDVLISSKRITIAATGIQWGKTTVGVMRHFIKMAEFTSKDDAFIVTAPTYKILYQSTMPVFKSICGDWFGRYNQKNESYKIKNGGTVYFRTGQNPDSVVGITNVRHILCDEGGLYTRYFFDNIQARSSIRRCPITIVTSPYSLNWLWTDYIRKYRDRDPFIMELVHLCQANSAENPYFSKDEYLERQRTMDPRRFAMVYGGVFDRAVGLVYDCFDVQAHVVDSLPLPLGTRYFGGIDWGYTDPCVIKVRAITPEGMHYSVFEIARTQMRISDIKDACFRLKQNYNIERFLCDPSRPDSISELNRFGLNCQPAQNDILEGIEKHYELIKNGDYAVFNDSNKVTIDEYETYHYADPKDLRPDQNMPTKLALPVDQSNHAMDCERYITMATYNINRFKKRVATNEIAGIPVKEVHNYDLERDKLLKKKRYGNIPL